MRVFKKIKGLLAVSSLLLVFAACGSQDYFSVGAAGRTGGAYTGTCNFATNSENVYIGDIVDDSFDFTYGPTEGSVQLSIIPSGGYQLQGQYTASAKLTLRGSEYCCTSPGGISGMLGYGIGTWELYTISNLALSCQSIAGSSGSFLGGGFYQPVTLKIGVYVSGLSEQTEYYADAVLTRDNRLRGFISVSSGVQNLGPIPNSGAYVYLLQ